ncbi:unnamed protein product [Chrysoparadoxa australica]
MSSAASSTIVACVIVSAASLVGVVSFALLGTRNLHEYKLSCLNAFAAGALITNAMVHFIPEGLGPLIEAYDGNVEEAAWRACLTILGAFTFALSFCEVLHGLEGFSKEEPKEGVDEEAVVLASVTNATTDEGTRLDFNYSKCNRDGKPGYRKVTDLTNLAPSVWNISIADFIHNTVDGMAIATAFLACDSSLGWAVTVSILLHEVPQEISDFFVLVKGGMTVLQAGLINLFSALTAIVGGIIILIIGTDISPVGQSYLLMANAGMFLHVACTDLLPKVFGMTKTERGWAQLRKRAFLLFCFVFGCVVIGLTLLSDVHCDAGHGHGHGHGHGDEHGDGDHSDDHGDGDDHSEE